MSMSFSQDGASSSSAPSSLLALLQRMGLTDPEPLDESNPSQEQETASSQEEDYASARSSLDFSFSSLHISAEEWEEIDREAHVAATSLPQVNLQQEHAGGATVVQGRGDIEESKDTAVESDALVSSITKSLTLSLSLSEASPIRASAAAVTETVVATADAAEDAKYKYSPSVLAHHANTACEKMLHLVGSKLWQESRDSNPPRTESIDVADQRAESEPEATMLRGVQFESRLQSSIQNRIDCEAENDTDSFFRLATSPEGFTLCQPIFSLDESFYTEEMKQAGIIFGRFIPDFIRILPGSIGPTGQCKKRLFIIDAKSSSHVKTSHQFQVTLYSIFLDHLIKLHKQEHLVELDPLGGVWIPQHEEPRTFSLTFMRPVVENFIYKELPAILMKPLRSAVWHIDSPCLQCEFLPRCKSDAREEQTLSVIPLLSKKSALWVKSLFKPASGRTEIEDLEDLVRGRERLAPVDQSSLTKILHLNNEGSSPLLVSFRRRELKVLNVRTMDLPLQHRDRLLINILTDPITQLLFAYSLDYFKEQSIRPLRSHANAMTFSHQDDLDRVSNHVRLAQDLIDTLYEWLNQISEIKPRTPVLSIFFYSQAMLSDLCTLLLRIVAGKPVGSHTWSPVTKSRAMDLLSNMYEDPSFLTLSELGSVDIKLPDLLQLTQGFKNKCPIHDKRLFSIERALQKLLVLPVVGLYSYKDIMTQLVDVRTPAIIDDRDRDDDGYNTNSLYRRWVKGTTAEDLQQTLRKWAEQQNVILIALYGLMRHECSDMSTMLLAPQAPFRMRSHFRFQHTILAQFAFFQQWEVIMQCAKRREIRAGLSRDEAMQHQYLYRGRFMGRHVGLLPGATHGAKAPRAPSNTPWSKYIGKFEVTSRVDPGSLVGSTFENYILSADTDAGFRDRIRFDDTNAILRSYGRGTPVIVSVSHYDSNTKIAYVSGAFNNMTEALALYEGQYYLFERREFSPTLTTSMDKFIEMNENCRLSLDLIKDPNRWGLQRPDKTSDVFIESIGGSARRYDMTLSQEKAFSKVITNRLQVIWGPPGSGKTHFLALTILRYIDILRSLSDKGKGQGAQTIVLTAFTHSAINNLAERVAGLHDQIAPHMGSEHIIRPFVLYRLGDASTVQVKGAVVVEPNGLAKLQGQPEDDGSQDIIRVVCGTVWQIRRAASLTTGVEYMRNVQMLMIDEGSQLLAADAVHAIEILDPAHGRLIVAGDHLQLGPVLVGEYPASEHALDPTGSIMKNLMRTRNNTAVPLQWVEGGPAMDIGPCTSQLQENFRMNDQLGLFMKRIYGPNYQVQNPNKTLPYSGGFRGLSYPADIRRILDPSRSAVCIELQLTPERHRSPEVVRVANDTRAAAALEAMFVAGIVESYLEMVGVNTITSVFVAVPHHIQRLAILARMGLPALEAKYPMAQIKVDTIDKMQGQEADMVVVCFALFDDFTLVNELGYLYSVHRWVVALSRARCKTVLLMTPELKRPRMIGGNGKANPRNQEALDGWGLMQAFERYAEELGGKLVWPIQAKFLRGIDM
ncbi:Tripartite DNA replication factor [Mortierella claussenii]|nr:Tripartite DNA replication factor [Mortierella claussenii]